MLLSLLCVKGKFGPLLTWNGKVAPYIVAGSLDNGIGPFGSGGSFIMAAMISVKDDIANRRCGCSSYDFDHQNASV